MKTSFSKKNQLISSYLKQLVELGKDGKDELQEEQCQFGKRVLEVGDQPFQSARFVSTIDARKVRTQCRVLAYNSLHHSLKREPSSLAVLDDLKMLEFCKLLEVVKQLSSFGTENIHSWHCTNIFNHDNDEQISGILHSGPHHLALKTYNHQKNR